jgi:hypothetical protein
MKTKPLFIGLVVGVIIGFFVTYLYFVSLNLTVAGQKFFAFIGGSVGIIAALAYFCRTYVEHRLGIEAERMKVRFSRTYELRASAIAEAHGKLLDLYDTVNDFQSTAGHEAGSDQWLAASNRINETRNNLIDFLLRKQLYLPKATTAKIRSLFQKVYGSHLRYTMLKEYPQEERSKEIKSWLAEKEQIPVYLKQLEDDFRESLGFLD